MHGTMCFSTFECIQQGNWFLCDTSNNERETTLLIDHRDFNSEYEWQLRRTMASTFSSEQFFGFRLEPNCFFLPFSFILFFSLSLYLVIFSPVFSVTGWKSVVVQKKVLLPLTLHCKIIWSNSWVGMKNLRDDGNNNCIYVVTTAGPFVELKGIEGN